MTSRCEEADDQKIKTNFNETDSTEVDGPSHANDDYQFGIVENITETEETNDVVPKSDADQRGLVEFVQNVYQTMSNELNKRENVSIGSPTSPIVESRTTATTTDQSTQFPSSSSSSSLLSSSNEPERPNSLSKKQKHIMMSYHSSCSELCNRIRGDLELRNYIVWTNETELRGNMIDGSAAAVGKSYIALLCLNRSYVGDEQCKKVAQYLGRKEIECIPCWMETPFQLVSWLDLMIGQNQSVDFTANSSFDEKMRKLINEISHHEQRLMTNPRQSPSNNDFLPTVSTNLTPLNRREFGEIYSRFRDYIKRNRPILCRTNPIQAEELVNELVENLRNEENSPDESKEEFLDQCSQLINRPDHSREIFSSTVKNTVKFLLQIFFLFVLIWALLIKFFKF